jgi:hypothetical protein
MGIVPKVFYVKRRREPTKIEPIEADYPEDYGVPGTPSYGGFTLRMLDGTVVAAYFGEDVEYWSDDDSKPVPESEPIAADDKPLRRKFFLKPSD